MTDLFGSQEQQDIPKANAPLADRLRPVSLDEVIGQEHLTGPDGAIGRMVAAGTLSSMILWGPPGTGKTSIARLLADAVGMHYKPISAVFSGVADLKKAFAEAETMARTGKQTLLFVDEIHRFNRAQQDGFLPFVESGVVTLVGATTENPSFELNAALLSRTQVMVLRRLDDAALGTLLDRAEAAEQRELPITVDARSALISSADGDGRFLLNQAATLFSIVLENPLDPPAMAALLQKRMPVYDKDREGHYNLISALHKSLRGSDPQAALYWMARMLVAGKNPYTSCAVLSALRARILVWPIHRHLSNVWPQKTPMSFSAARKGNWRSYKPVCISRPHPNPMLHIKRKRLPGNWRGRRGLSCPLPIS
jgi:putative ATPase